MKNLIHHRDTETQSIKWQKTKSSQPYQFSACFTKTLCFCVSVVKCLFILFFFSQVSSAQNEPEEIVPPPIKVVSKSELSQLGAESELKRRTKLSLELMEARLLKAEGFAAKEEYREMFDDLGGFHGLMDNTINFLTGSDTNKGKVLNNFKRVELSLRKYVTRLELIRRNLPIKYERYVRSLVKYVREARSKAVEPMFGETVLPDNDNEK